jgi:hypothetical protein
MPSNLNDTTETSSSRSDSPGNICSDQVNRHKKNEENQDINNSGSGRASSTHPVSNKYQKLLDEPVMPLRKRKRMNESISQKQSINPFRQPVKYS